MYYVAVAVVALVLLMLQYATWAWLHADIQADPMSGVALSFWTVQVVGALAFAALCVVGFKPEVEIIVGDELLVRHGDETHAFDYASFLPSVIDTQLYYDHYRKYEKTTSFVGRLSEPHLLLLELANDRHVVIEVGLEARKLVADRRIASTATVGVVSPSASRRAPISQTA